MGRRQLQMGFVRNICKRRRGEREDFDFLRECVEMGAESIMVDVSCVQERVFCSCLSGG